MWIKFILLPPFEPPGPKFFVPLVFLARHEPFPCLSLEVVAGLQGEEEEVVEIKRASRQWSLSKSGSFQIACVDE